MKQKQNFYSFIICLILIIYSFVYKFIILNTYKNGESIITSAFFIVLFIISILMFGFSKNKINLNKKKITILTFIIVIVGIIVTYALGAFVGFLRNGYSQTFKNIVRNTFAPLFIIIFTELFRYNIIRANKNNFKIISLVTVLLTILEILMSLSTNIDWGFIEIYIATTSIIIPLIAKNMLMSYLSYEIGYLPCLIYRLILELQIYLVPYVPNFGDYLKSMYGLIMPTVVFSYASSLIDEYNDGIKQEYIAQKTRIIEGFFYVFIFLFIALISRVFPIFMIGVGSGSMTGTINKGDAVIAYKDIKEPKIEVNDIIVFESPGKILIHRVVEIEEIDGIKYYRTKGDINGTRDNLDTTIDKIQGKVKYRIPYIAIPSVALSEFISTNK